MTHGNLSSEAAAAVAVELTHGGSVRGFQEGLAQNQITIFLGIPYAEPPFGSNRFLAPAPASWTGVREAPTWGPTAPQIPVDYPFSKLIHEPVIPGSGCLTLNVWTPNVSGSRPVMVWIHGGAFRTGSGAVTTYDGSTFARQGIVCVSINYRLGVEGFAHLPDAPANRGLLDQIAALQWVRDNIAAFGGDPGNVTVAGESAGAMSVTTLLSLDLGLFGQAIMQSGAGHCAQEPEDAELVTAELARRLDVEPTAAGLAALHPDVILPVQDAISKQVVSAPDPATWGESTVMSGMAFLPVIDGELVKKRPIRAIADGAGKDVPVLTGTNSQEYRLFLAPVGAIDLLPWLEIPGVPSAVGLLKKYGIIPAVQSIYNTYKAQEPIGTRDGGIFSAVVTDFFFRIPAYRVAEAREEADQSATTYVYEFDWRSPKRVYGQTQLGACHALELGFVFHTLETSISMTGESPPHELAAKMHAAWVDFIKSGDPGWQRFDTTDRPVQTFAKADDIEIVEDPRPTTRVLWDGFVTFDGYDKS
jgi:para-nitrobenzyl esterase